MQDWPERPVHDCALSTDELRLPAEKQYESDIQKQEEMDARA